MANKRTLEEVAKDLEFHKKILEGNRQRVLQLEAELYELSPKFMPKSDNDQILLWREDCKPVAHYIMGSIVFINSPDSPVGIDLNDIPELISYLERCMKRKTFKEPPA